MESSAGGTVTNVPIKPAHLEEAEGVVHGTAAVGEAGSAEAAAPDASQAAGGEGLKLSVWGFNKVGAAAADMCASGRNHSK
jgi:hypothetical protein